MYHVYHVEAAHGKRRQRHRAAARGEVLNLAITLMLVREFWPADPGSSTTAVTRWL